MRAALLAAPGWLGVKDVPTPICPEGGVVVEFKEGDRVQVAPGLRCGKCFACKKTGS
ncbi:MAG: alcohol dehydrogenase catalytic domain-containing protein [Deltaproteobacteria bacterium]|nr:alcohol dehydrogenase catalytic domain-containing protein [Deltaproteobacteria bacterium]MDL1962613.1 alcohol dehydrogenase catalytic domain-containing protein [Deltaproteobacteria bacterium]